MPSSRKARTVFAFGLAACILELEREEKQKQRRNKYRIRPYLKKRGNLENLLQSPTLFFENFHMSELTFNALFGLVEKHLVSKRNTDPETISVPPKTQLGIVLQFLATGELRRHSGYRNPINTQDLRSILEKVCDAICEGLQDEFPKWTTENMLKWADEFEKKLKFPNCLGVVGGKHVAIKKPSNSDDLFLNYKGFHSVVIVAICDAFYRFTYIDVGAFGKGGDQYAFTQSKLGKDLLSDKLPFPKDSMLNDNETPYYIAGNDAFPLHLRLMKPYFGKHLDEKEQVFNSKLSDTLRCIENAFAILSARWMAFQRTLPNQPYEAQKIIATCCYLHNFLMRESPETYTITPDSEIPPNTVMTELRPCRRGRPLDYCKELRNNLKEYLNSCA